MSLVNQMLQDLDRRQAQDAQEFIHQNECLTQINADKKPAAQNLRTLAVATSFALLGSGAYVLWQGSVRTPDNFYQVSLVPVETAEADDAVASEVVPTAATTTQFVAIESPPLPAINIEPKLSDYETVAALDIEPPLTPPATPPSNNVFAPSYGPSPAALSPKRKKQQKQTTHVAESTPIKPAKPEPALSITATTSGVDKIAANATSVPAAPTTVADKPRETISIKPAESSAQRSYKQARVHLDAWETHDARRELGRTLVFDPGHNAARELLVALLLQDGQHLEAEPIVDVGLALYPGHSPFAQLKARLMSARGDTQQAIDILRSVASSPQHSFDHNSVLAAMYQKLGNHERAARTYLALIELRPETASLWSGLAMSLDAQGQFQAALKSYKHALSTQRLSPELRRYAQQRVEAINTAIGENS